MCCRYFSQGVDYYDHRVEPGLHDMAEGRAATSGYGPWETGARYRGNYSTTLFRDAAVARVEEAAASAAATATAMTLPQQAHESKATQATQAATPLFLWVAFQAVHRDNSSSPPEDALSDDNRAELASIKAKGVPQNR